MTPAFVDPGDRVSPLEQRNGELVSATGRRFRIVDDVADFTAAADAAQQQTSDSFGYKWNRQPDWGFKPEHQSVMRQVWADVFAWPEAGTLADLMRGQVVLDAGCGSGASLGQFVDWPASIVAADISDAIYACRRRFASRSNIAFIKADVTRLPFPDRVFDVIWSAGVLHHTPDTGRSLAALVRHLKVAGRIVIYVYGRKAPVREFVDDFIREQIADLPAAEAWRRMEALTRFARSLSAIKAPLHIEEDVPELGFSKGTYDLQRFVYYKLFKCFWNDALSFDDNVHVNFDWYHPRYSHRHTPEEVRTWLADLQLATEHFHISESGIAVIARRTA
jgi:SAM-dependent methyltransferase